MLTVSCPIQATPSPPNCQVLIWAWTGPNHQSARATTNPKLCLLNDMMGYLSASDNVQIQ